MRNNRYRNYEKPAWEIEKERIAREREEAIQRNIQPTEENFPALGGGVVKQNTWGGRKFTELATEWSVADEEAKAREELEKKAEVTKPERFVMPHFTPSRRYEEADWDPVPSAPPSSPSPIKEDGDEWTTIDRAAKNQARLARRQARIEERLRRLDEGETEESEDENPEDNEDTCWEHDVAPVGKSFHS